MRPAVTLNRHGSLRGTKVGDMDSVLFEGIPQPRKEHTGENVRRSFQSHFLNSAAHLIGCVETVRPSPPCRLQILLDTVQKIQFIQIKMGADAHNPNFEGATKAISKVTYIAVCQKFLHTRDGEIETLKTST